MKVENIGTLRNVKGFVTAKVTILEAGVKVLMCVHKGLANAAIERFNGTVAQIIPRRYGLRNMRYLFLKLRQGRVKFNGNYPQTRGMTENITVKALPFSRLPSASELIPRNRVPNRSETGRKRGHNRRVSRREGLPR